MIGNYILKRLFRQEATLTVEIVEGLCPSEANVKVIIARGSTIKASVMQTKELFTIWQTNTRWTIPPVDQAMPHLKRQ